jgi:hypothetical protein
VIVASRREFVAPHSRALLESGGRMDDDTSDLSVHDVGIAEAHPSYLMIRVRFLRGLLCQPSTIEWNKMYGLWRRERVEREIDQLVTDVERL